MIKRGKFTIEDAGREGYDVYSRAMDQLGRPQAGWGALGVTAQAAWFQGCGTLTTYQDRYEGRKWGDVAHSVYDIVRAGAGLSGEYDSVDFPDLDAGDQLAFEMVVRHLVNCMQADDDDDMGEALEELFSNFTRKLEGVAHD